MTGAVVPFVGALDGVTVEAGAGSRDASRSQVIELDGLFKAVVQLPFDVRRCALGRVPILELLTQFVGSFSGVVTHDGGGGAAAAEAG